jgi:hypothetical protein
MQVILDDLIHRTNRSRERLCVKPIHNGELHIGINDVHKFVELRLEVLEIVCTTNLQATIGNIGAVDVLRVECSNGSPLQLSGLQGIRSLKEVWLKGSCSHALKQDLKRQPDQSVKIKINLSSRSFSHARPDMISSPTRKPVNVFQ